MPSHFHKKFRWGTVFATGRRSFIELGTGLRMKRTNRRTRVLIDLYPCHIEEKMTIKEVRGESVMEWKTKNIIPHIVTQVTANVNNANGGDGNGRNNGCSYKNFTSCIPKEFDGKGVRMGQNQRACNECGSLDHLRYDCPKWKQATGQARNPLSLEGNRNTRNNGNRSRGGAFNENAVEALQDPKVVVDRNNA
ncbi:putative reverse transcriptase domain-containing protein [Tanacetum coccineum]